MKRELRVELRTGLLLFAAWGVLNHFADVHHFILGGLIGASICLMIVGSLGEVPYNALKSFNWIRKQ